MSRSCKEKPTYTWCHWLSSPEEYVPFLLWRLGGALIILSFTLDVALSWHHFLVWNTKFFAHFLSGPLCALTIALWNLEFTLAPGLRGTQQRNHSQAPQKALLALLLYQQTPNGLTKTVIMAETEKRLYLSSHCPTINFIVTQRGRQGPGSGHRANWWPWAVFICIVN